MPHLLDRAARTALDLLFPQRCALCHAAGEALCAACASALPRAETPRCALCWTDITRGSSCEACRTEPPSFASARAPFTHDDGARRLIHLLKYDNLTSLAEPMGQAMAALVNPADFDVVAPVPLHAARERSRGYNQAERLASWLARECAMPLDAGAMRRLRATKPLVRAMGRDERRAIVRGAFAARRERVEGRRVLLIDDVMTTGATLDACATALLEAGARQVRALTFGRA